MQVVGLGISTIGTRWANPRLKNTLIISWHLVSLQTCTKHCQKGFVHLSLVRLLTPYQMVWQIVRHLVVSHAHNVNCVPAPVNERDLYRYPFTGIKPNRQQRLFPYDQGFNLCHLGGIWLRPNLDLGGHNLSQSNLHKPTCKGWFFLCPWESVFLKQDHTLPLFFGPNVCPG